MDDSYAWMPIGTARQYLQISDHFTGTNASPNVRIEAETMTDTGEGALWSLTLLPGYDAAAYAHEGIGYWVRLAILTTKEMDKILCPLGFSPESGKFLKLLQLGPGGYLSVYFQSGPVTHILNIE